MNSIVISPFWQSVDEHWIGATLVAISLAVLISTAVFVARYRSILFFLITSGLVFLTAFLLAPIADARSPKMFQLWLMSPETLAGLSLAQIFISSLAVFGSIRQEVHKKQSDRLLYKIRSWIVVVVAALPSPILIVFIFWLEQNMMITTREQVPAIIGLKIAFVLTLIVGVTSCVLFFFDRYRLLGLHFFIGLFLVLTGALLPCLTTKLSSGSLGDSAYTPNALSVLLVLTFMVAIVFFGILHKTHRVARK